MAKAATSPSFPGCELSVAVPGGGHPQVPIASLLQSCAFVLLCLEVTRRAAALQGGWTELFKGSDLLGKQKGWGGQFNSGCFYLVFPWVEMALVDLLISC